MKSFCSGEDFRRGGFHHADFCSDEFHLAANEITFGKYGRAGACSCRKLFVHLRYTRDVGLPLPTALSHLKFQKDNQSYRAAVGFRGIFRNGGLTLFNCQNLLKQNAGRTDPVRRIGTQLIITKNKEK